MEFEIVNKKTTPKLNVAPSSAKHLTYNNTSAETDGAIVSKEKHNMDIRTTPNKK